MQPTKVGRPASGEPGGGGVDETRMVAEGSVVDGSVDDGGANITTTSVSEGAEASVSGPVMEASLGSGTAIVRQRGRDATNASTVDAVDLILLI